MGKGKILYIILVVIALATLLPWPFVAYTSLFAFDAPGSDKDPATLALIVPIWIYPVILLCCAGVSWLMYRRQKLNLAIALACIPLVLVILYVAVAAIFFSRNG
jgi:hypothetical protein